MVAQPNDGQPHRAIAVDNVLFRLKLFKPMKDSPMDMEARAHSEHPEALRLWLRLLTCTQIVEKQVRTQLRERFDTTLPRFDLMAQLERAPDGLKMNELSRRMMGTGGNCTGITRQPGAEGLVGS